jgi:tRNA pseudouridine55 synthase
MIIEFYKKIGETPLQAIIRFKKEYPEHEKSKISYAGRLDPMAHGTLILLINDSCKLQNTLHRLSKVYRFKMLFGVSTDTYDILGVLTSITGPTHFTIDEIKRKLMELKETDYYQKYPPYSSYRINGKPLWEWAKIGKLDEVYDLVQSKKVNIENFKILGIESKKGSELYKIVKDNISKLGAKEKQTFRSTEILKNWLFNFQKDEVIYQVFDIEIDVSSGTYIRSICSDIGKMLGTNAIALDIERLKVNIT